MRHSGGGIDQPAPSVKVAAIRLGHRALTQYLGAHRAGKLPALGHVVRAADAMQHHVRALQKRQRLVNLDQLAHLLQRLFVQMVGEMHHAVMAAQAAGDLTGEGIGLGFQRAAHSAARGYHHHIHGRALRHRKSHLANGAASRYGQRTTRLQKASQASAGNAAHLAQHMRVCIGISGGHTHLVYSQLLGQRRLQPGQSLQIPAEAPGHGQHALRRRSQAHSRRIQRNQAMLFQQRRHRAYLALRQVEPGGQLPSAHGLQRADAFQYQRTQFDFLRQIRSQLLHQGKITVLHCILPIRDKSRPA